MAFAGLMLMLAFVARTFTSAHLQVQYGFFGLLAAYFAFKCNLHWNAPYGAHLTMRLLTLPVLAAAFYATAKLALVRDAREQRLLRGCFAVAVSDQPVRPAGSGEFGMFLDTRWYRLTIRPEFMPAPSRVGDDPIGRLPITLLTRNVIEPLFGITDPRIDKRIDFVGGARGLVELAQRVCAGDMAVAFALYPTQMPDLMAVADAGLIMPPKSTWFEPKLADGMVNHVLD